MTSQIALIRGRGGISSRNSNTLDHAAQAACSNCHQRAKCVMSSTAESDRFTQSTFSELTFEAGSTILVEEQPSESLYVVKTGSLQASTAKFSNTSSVVGFMFPNDVIGAESLDLGIQAFTITALENTRICAIDKKEVLKSMRTQSSFQIDIFRKISKQLLEEKKMAFKVCRGSVEARISAFILHLYKKYDCERHISQDIILSMPRSAISSYMGVTPESLSRGLSALSKKKVINVFNRRVSILDMDQLKLLSLSS